MAFEDLASLEYTSVVVPRLKLWNRENKIASISSAVTSNNGELIALCTASHSVHVTHVKKSYEDSILNDVHCFIWGSCDWKNEKCLDYPTTVNYLLTISSDFNINVFSFSSSDEGLFTCLKVASVEPCVLCCNEDIPCINQLSIVCSLYNIDGSSHQVVCVANMMHLLQLTVSVTEEPYVRKTVELSKLSDRLGGKDNIKMHEYKDGLVYLVTDDLMLYTLCVTDFRLVKKINIYEKLQLIDVLQFAVSGGTDWHTVMFLESGCEMHFLKLPSLLHNQKNVSARQSWSHSDMWKDMVRHTRSHYEEDLPSRLGDFHDSKSVPLLPWMSHFHVTGIRMSSSSVLLLQQHNENSGKRILARYDIIKDIFSFNEIPADVCLSNCWNEQYPTLYISLTTISIPTFSTTEEELIDKVLQYSDIQVAELICKSNEWSQFSVPLHTLKIGLQHRQLDVISFFLKSRQKVFTAYWEDVDYATRNSVTDKSVAFIGSFDSNEMYEAIEMLVTAITNNSQGKHKQSFFEGLLRVTIKYFNGLIQDGVAAQEIKTRSASNGGDDLQISLRRNSSFSNDITLSLQYLTHKLIELRQFLRHPLEDTEKSVVVEGKKVIDLTAECIEDCLVTGRIPTLQKLMVQQGRDGKLASIVKIGRETVNGMLREEKIEKAEMILFNLGLESKKELKQIYMSTIERTLRDFLYASLKRKELLTESDLEDYLYIKKLEEIYVGENFLISSNNHTFTWTTSISLTLPVPLSSELLPELIPKTPTEDIEGHLLDNSGSLYSQLSMKHVECWDERRRKLIVLDGIFITNSELNVGNEYSSELWEYLISHNQMSLLQKWIENVASSKDPQCRQVFPDLPDEMPMDSISTEVKEMLFHLLVENGYYPECLLENFPELLHYLCVTKVLFNGFHPMDYYKKSILDESRRELIDNFNNNFICFCQENDLVMVLWYYVSCYGISLSTVTIKDKIKSWLSMLLSFHDTAIKWKEQEDKDSLLFTAFSENARFLHDKSGNACKRYTLNKMLHNSQPVTAIACLLVCQNILSITSLESDNIHQIDEELLEKSLYLYPHLYQAIYSDNSKNGDFGVTTYKLVQDNTELDVSRWFCWQPENDIAMQGDNIIGELPQFSHAILVKRYAHEVKLDHRFYLEQCRPMYAYLVYMRDIDHSEGKHCLGKNILMLETYTLGIQNFKDLSIIASCALFLELSEMDSEKLSTDTRVATNICMYWDRQQPTENKYSAEELEKYLIEIFLMKNNSNRLLDILKLLEDTTETIIQDKNIERLSYDAVWYWELVMSFCQLHKLPLSTRYIEACCAVDDWLQLFLFIYFYQLPSELVISVIENHMTNKILKNHIIAVIRSTKMIGVTKPAEKQKKRKKIGKSTDKRDVSSTEEKEKEKEGITFTSTPKKEERANSVNTISQDAIPKVEPRLLNATGVPDNVIDIILICEEREVPWKSLTSYAIVLRNEILALLAACYDNADLVTCHCVWYICSISDENDYMMLQLCEDLLGIKINKEDIPLALQTHHWTEKDLLVLTKRMLLSSIKYAKLILQGFKIFKKDHILVYILEFSELFLFKEEPVVSLEKIKKFQSEYERIKNGETTENCSMSDDDARFCELFSYQVAEVLLLLCKDTYHVYKLVGQLADANFAQQFSISVPNYTFIQKTVSIVYSAGVKYPVERLFNINEASNMQCIDEIFEELLKASCFDQASELSHLHCLPQSKITLQKVICEFKEISDTKAWENISTRHAFMNKADKVFFEQKCCCDLAASFFENQAHSSNSIYTSTEKSFLLLLAMQWYHTSIIGDKSSKISELEKEVWMYQIKAEVESQKSEPCVIPPVVQHNNIEFGTCNVPHSYFQRTCSNVTMVQYNDLTELLQESREIIEQGPSSSLLTTQEEYSALERFIGKLLDNNYITEAKRVASYFQRTTNDLEIVLAAIYLAQGNEIVDGLSDNIKSILASTTSRHITISGLLERSGSFSRLEALQAPVAPSAGCMKEYVFIEEIQNALEKLTLRVDYGKKCLEQVLVCFKIATMLSMSYEATVTEDFYVILREVLDKGIDVRKQLSRQFIKAFDLPVEEVANFIAETMINWIKISCGVVENNVATDDETSFSIASSRTFDQIVSLLKLTENTVQVGNIILEEVIDLSKSNVSHSRNSPDLICEVEMLIYAHHCFTICCDMEGIARILHFAGLCTKSLARLQMHSQMARLLTGIGRFNEMVYVIETLYNQHHFEILCNQGHIKEDKLKKALLDFLKKYHPKDHDNFQIVAYGFGMYRELAQHHESVGKENINLIKDEISNQSKDLASRLKDIKKTFSYAADYYLKEECVGHAQKCIRMARLVELQGQLLPSGRCVLGLTPKEVKLFLRAHENFLESYMVADSYELDISSCFVEPIFHIVVLNGKFNYLQQYQSYLRLTPSTVTQVASLFLKRNEAAESTGNMKQLVNCLHDLKTKIKLAKDLDFPDIEKQTLDSCSGAFLRDHLF